MQRLIHLPPEGVKSERAFSKPYFGFFAGNPPRPAQDAYRCSATTFCTRRLPLLCNHAPHKTLTVALQGTTYCEQEFNAVNVEIPH